MKIGRTMKVIVLMMLSMFSVMGSIELSVTPARAAQLAYPSYPFVSVYPYNETCSVNETFTVSVIAYNLTNGQIPDPFNGGATTISLGNLYGFDVQLTWDPTIIQCINHTITAPFENYSKPIPPSPYGGILYGYGPENNSLLTLRNIVNESGIVDASAPDVRAWFTMVNMYPGAPFNGNGTICTMTFKVLKKGITPLQIVSLTIADVDANPIGQSTNGAWLNPPRSGMVTVVGAPHPSSPTYSPRIGVVDKPMYFSTAVTGNDTPVATYTWDFGDGTSVENTTTPTVEHNYTSSSTYSVTVTAFDVDGAEGSNSTSGVMVAASRDLAATSITLSQSTILPNKTLTVTTMASNLGSASFTFNENCTMRLYYNASSLGSSTTWDLVGTKQNVIISTGIDNYEYANFQLNSSSLPKLEAYYYFEFNVTGIPSGYEANTANNIKLSSALLYTNKTVYGVEISDFIYGYMPTSAVTVGEVPVISSENTNVSIGVKNIGDNEDQFNLTLYVNSSVVKTWETKELGVNISQTFNWGYALGAGNYTLTAAVSGGLASPVNESRVLMVVKTPSIVVDYSPKSPVVGQEVTINGSGSVDGNPGGKIVAYSWKIFAPGVAITAPVPNATLSGPLVNFNFSESGNWTVLLTLTDNVAGYNLTVNAKRKSTLAYEKPIVISVTSASGYLIGLVIGIIVIVIVIIIAVSVILLRRRRVPKPNP